MCGVVVKAGFLRPAPDSWNDFMQAIHQFLNCPTCKIRINDNSTSEISAALLFEGAIVPMFT